MMSFSCLSLILLLLWQDHYTGAMNSHVSHFEYLKYDIYHLHEQHERTRRSTSSQSQPVKLQFESHGRFFDLRLVPDKTVFHPDAVIDSPKGATLGRDVSHLYHGTLYGKRNSVVHGSIIDGIFRGVIEDPDKGNYYVEENFNFFGGKVGQSPISGYMGHSVIYHQDAVKFPKTLNSHSHCGASKTDIMDRMKNFQNSSLHEHGETQAHLSRRKRALDPDHTTCMLYIQTDHVLFDEYPHTDVIISKIAEHVKAASRIYSETVFDTPDGSIRGLNFKVRRLRVNDSDTANDRSNPFRNRNIGVEKFLDIASMANHNDYCLAYVFTSRDFDNGVLGLAWVGSPGGSSGGICERFNTFSDGSAKSLNTGIVTFKNYGSIMPARVTHITFAHELGHNFGSPHDSGRACTPGESFLSSSGNFIMYAKATEGSKPNNGQFSDCSKRNMSAVLRVRKDQCFVRSDEPICGNQIIDEGEECDCGYNDTCRDLGDICCVPADDRENSQRCKLKPGKACSITQGPCCNTATCTIKSTSIECSPKTDCQRAQTCDGVNPTCPPPALVANTTLCLNDTKVCISGECSGSLCLSKDGLEPCECKVPPGSKDRSLLCHTCCQLEGQADTCKSSGDPSFSKYFSNVTYLQPGSACDDFKGYCDVFSNCRLVDADGPLSRLKQAIFNPELYSKIRLWIIEYWWAVALMTLALILLMGAFIKVCSLHTPTSNPRLQKHKQFPGTATLQRRRNRQQQQHARQRQQQRGYEMAHRS